MMQRANTQSTACLDMSSTTIKLDTSGVGTVEDLYGTVEPPEHIPENFITCYWGRMRKMTKCDNNLD